MRNSCGIHTVSWSRVHSAESLCGVLKCYLQSVVLWFDNDLLVMYFVEHDGTGLVSLLGTALSIMFIYINEHTLQLTFELNRLCVGCFCHIAMRLNNAQPAGVHMDCTLPLCVVRLIFWLCF